MSVEAPEEARRATVEARREFEEAREAWRIGEASQARYRQTFEAWFRASVLAGDPPDALQPQAGSIEQRIEQRIVQGADHDYWTGRQGKRARPILHVGDREINVQRFLYTVRTGETLSKVVSVETICGEPLCVRDSHLVAVRRNRHRYTKQQMIGALQVDALRRGHAPTIREWAADRLRPNHVSIRERFGSWNAALAEAGLAVRPTGRGLHYVPEEMLAAAIAEKAAELGRPPTASEWERGLWAPSYSTIQRRFGSWGAALAAAGLGDE